MQEHPRLQAVYEHHPGRPQQPEEGAAGAGPRSGGAHQEHHPTNPRHHRRAHQNLPAGAGAATQQLQGALHGGSGGQHTRCRASHLGEP